MKKVLVLLAVLVSAIALAQVNIDVFGSYDFVLFATPTTASPTAYVSFGALVTYEVSEGVEIGGGVGLAWFLGDATNVANFLGVSTQYALDLLVAAKYNLPIDDFSSVTIKGYGGLSIPGFTSFTSLGYVVGINALYTFDVGEFAIGVGAGIEMRTYGTSNCTAVPVGANVSIKF
ncbi:hypothetical protein [Thermotoga profunda]|uniref:hypothetical protein n=1 Tax=Thermotoga profunda TaxID=1508420 RepID=UPI0005975F2C|nr:hypothetical protein [Thermotoga profunda]